MSGLVGREGELVTSRLTLKPGLNSFIGTVARGAVVESAESDAPKEYVAKYLADMLGQPLEFIGREPTGMTKALVYNIGYARPAHFWLIGNTDRWESWYQKMGSPVGSDVYFVATNVDWRGPTRDLVYPAGNVAFPGEPSVISSNWPDGNTVEQKKLLAESTAAADRVKTFDYIKQGVEGVDKYARGNFPFPGAGRAFNTLFMFGVGGGLLYWLLKMKQVAPRPAKV